ncbi:MAG: NAD(P)/FAD-dependent oxidoreductase [Xenococcus sp. MO_188.B8]|nr:NAD(P)/FAD-dependent oxidoreductase [Xenococcus sp. MO_188.B8]
MLHSVDILIIGGGSAGTTTAIFLSQLGYSVLLLTREEKVKQKIGESLSPFANPILKKLGVWDTFIADGHLPCYGNKSSWGKPQLDYYDFINHPLGHAWHIDRCLFEQRLMERAIELGVERINNSSIVNLDKVKGKWQIQIDQGTTTISAKFIVDASGRNHYWARRQGIKRLHDDRQVALVTFLTAKHLPLEDTSSLVEAVPDGWWYSALLPNGCLVTAFMTDLDLHQRPEILQKSGWYKLLDKTYFTAERIHDRYSFPDEQPLLVAANSSRLQNFYGEDWLAVGDAAMSYDPLSSHGLTMAMVSGRDAAQVISAQLNGDRQALDSYADQMYSAYSHYAAMRSQFYHSETRWPNFPYWLRRAKF